MSESLITVPAAGAAGHLVASLLQTVLHRCLGHRPVARFFFRRHIFDHHRIYSTTHLVAKQYSDDERSLTPYYLIPSVAVILALACVLPTAPLIAFSAMMLASYAAHAYVHEHYHLERSWLNRWAWFSKRRQLHYIHHRNTRRNFAVIDFFWDRLFGTFESQSSSRPAESQ